jgi:uncharacterized membrane protein YraQ (UPF0718 family)
MLHILTHTLSGALLMLWETFWALAFGFGMSAFLQVFVRRESITKQFGKTNLRSVGLATFLGAVSSSCSYAAAAATRSAFKKGADLVPALAFMFASTNLVLELGFVLWIFLGWHFVLAEGVGSFVLIAIMWALVRLTLPRGLVEEARHHEEGSNAGGCCHHDHGDEHEHHDDSGPRAQGSHPTFATKFRDPHSWSAVADAFVMDVSMMWKEVAIGFLIAGFLMAAVPHHGWQVLFLSHDAPAGLRLVENCVVGVLVAVASFVCSVGNIPLAALLWSGGIGFGGVISFIYADLVIIPLLLIYRKYYGAKAATYIAAVLFASMVGAGIVVDLLFNALGLVPMGPRPPSLMQETTFQWNYTTWLDLLVLAALAVLFLATFLHKRSRPVHDSVSPHHPATTEAHHAHH